MGTIELLESFPTRIDNYQLRINRYDDGWEIVYYYHWGFDLLTASGETLEQAVIKMKELIEKYKEKYDEQIH